MEENEEKTETNIAEMPNHIFDEAVTNMQENIQKQIALENALVSEKENVLSLQHDYSCDDDIYIQKIQQLSSVYSHVRKTRGDGNCFYRAFGFGYLEYLLHHPEDHARFRKKVEATKAALESLGYPTFTVEDFYEQFIEIVDSVGSNLKLDGLKEIFCNEGISNYLVVYLRLITSSYLQQNSDFYQNFMDDGRPIVDFCKGEVEPMDRESDHIHIIAISSALNLCIRVAYVDRGDEITYHNFPEDSSPQLHLLYRPGHYDIIYPI